MLCGAAGVLVWCSGCVVWCSGCCGAVQQVTVDHHELLLVESCARYNPNLPIDEQTEVLSYDLAWEFPINRLTFGLAHSHKGLLI